MLRLGRAGLNDSGSRRTVGHPGSVKCLAIAFGQQVRSYQERRGLSQEALAFAAGLHRTHISLIERAHRSVRLETVETLARALRVQPGELMPEIRLRSR